MLDINNNGSSPSTLLGVKNVHFIGIGGIGVSAVARMFLLEGKQVSGSDRSESEVTRELAKLGAKIFVGHATENVANDIDLIIYTIAIPPDNPELARARELGIKAITYPQALGLISADKKTVAVAGTHGKTTTTAMLAQIAITAQLEPTVIVGSFLLDHASNFIAGRGDLFIVEACEYQRSFLNLNPQIVIITNIEADHLDYYRDLADIQNAFAELVAKIPADGFLICNPNDSNLAPILVAAKCQIIDYTQIDTKELNLPVPGAHNVLNAQAALAVAEILKVSPSTSFSALNKFSGTWRRFQFKGELPGDVLIYDDYAHHPTEIRATLAAAREKFPERRIMAVFQPHLYSRTRQLLADFGSSFNDADRVLLAPIYAAREMPDGVTSSDQLAEAIGSKATSYSDLPAITAALKNTVQPNDLIITLGAGNICEVAEALLS
jgi:UDP-N-acetylmuramate--alanine ligase